MAAEQDAAARTGGSDPLNGLRSYTTRWDTIHADHPVLFRYLKRNLSG
jgi:hypothetical protein